MREKLYNWVETQELKVEEQQNEQLITLQNNEVLNEAGPMQQERLSHNEALELLDGERSSIKRNMPAKLSFFGKAALITQKRYTFTKNGRQIAATRKWDTTYMKPVVMTLSELEKLLDEPVDVTRQRELHEAFLNVIEACEKYLIKRKNPHSPEGQARWSMVEDFHKQLTWESARFDGLMDELSAHPEKQANYANWGALFAEVRTEDFTDGQDGVTIEEGGKGTSDLFIIEKDGKKLYFKESEQVPSDKYSDIIDNEKVKLDTILTKYQGDKREELEQQVSRRKKILDMINGALMQKYGTDYKVAKLFLNNHGDKYSLFTDIKNLKYTGPGQKPPVDGVPQNLGQALSAIVEPEDIIYMQDTLWSLRKAMTTNCIAKYDAYIGDNRPISDRNVATARMAKLLGLSDLIVDTKMCDITINGSHMRGIMMDEAKGTTINHIYNRKLSYSPAAIKQLMSLQVFDIICGQVDRHPGNYLVTTSPDNPNRVDKITGIDNDLCFGRLTYKDILFEGKDGYKYIRNIENNGDFTLPGLDRKLAYRILALQPELICHQMCDVLDTQERDALKDRILGVQKAIRNAMQSESKARKSGKKIETRFISDDKQWEKLGDDMAKKLAKPGFSDEVGQISYLDKDLLNSVYREKYSFLPKMSDAAKNEYINDAFKRVYGRDATKAELTARRRHFDATMEYSTLLKDKLSGAEVDNRPAELLEDFKNIKTLSRDDRSQLIAATELFFTEILEMDNLSDFAFNKREDLLDKDLKTLYKQASLGKSSLELFDKYMKLYKPGPSFSLNYDDLNEIHAKLFVLDAAFIEYKSEISVSCNEYALFLDAKDCEYISQNSNALPESDDPEFDRFTEAVKERAYYINTKPYRKIVLEAGTDGEWLLNKARSLTGSKYADHLSYGKAEERGDIKNRDNYTPTDLAAYGKLDAVISDIDRDLKFSGISDNMKSILNDIKAYVLFLKTPEHMSEYAAYKIDPDNYKGDLDMPGALRGMEYIKGLGLKRASRNIKFGLLGGVDEALLSKYRDHFKSDEMSGKLEIPDNVETHNTLEGFDYTHATEDTPLLLDATGDNFENAFSMDEKQLTPENYRKKGNLICTRKKTVMEDVSELTLFAKEPSISDVRQGNISDCFLLAALNSLLSSHPESIQEMMKDHGSFVTVRFFTYDRRPVYVNVKKTLARTIYSTDNPADGERKAEYRGAGLFGSALWVQLLEKAFAASRCILEKDSYFDLKKRPKANDLYDMASNGTASQAMGLLTGNDSVRVYNVALIDRRFWGTISYSSFLEGMRKDARSVADEASGKSLSNKEWNIKKAKLFFDLDLMGSEDPRYELFRSNTIFREYSDYIGRLMKKHFTGTTFKTDTDVHLLLYVLEKNIDSMPDFPELGDKKDNRMIKERYLKYIGKYMLTSKRLEHVAGEAGKYNNMEKELYNKIKSARNEHRMITGSPGDLSLAYKGDTGPGGEATVFGLAASHAYTILDVEEEDATVNGEQRRLKYVIVSNPWKDDTTRQYDKTTGLPFMRSGDTSRESPKGTYRIELKDFVHMFRYVYLEEDDHVNV